MISKHISYNEAIKSSTATRKAIKNIPNEYELANMSLVADKIFEPLREWVGGKIRVNSFFRSEKLNIAIGGSSRSQHCQGRAIDIDDTFGYKTNAEMFNYIKDNLNFDRNILRGIKAMIKGIEAAASIVFVMYQAWTQIHKALRIILR